MEKIKALLGGEENAELINTALKSLDGCNTTKCTSDSNYASTPIASHQLTHSPSVLHNHQN